MQIMTPLTLLAFELLVSGRPTGDLHVHGVTANLNVLDILYYVMKLSSSVNHEYCTRCVTNPVMCKLATRSFSHSKIPKPCPLEAG